MRYCVGFLQIRSHVCNEVNVHHIIPTDSNRATLERKQVRKALIEQVSIHSKNTQIEQNIKVCVW